ncbi:hypothetical protein BZA05DRAFT_448560 [Tricharina praecox]|uniref:uncharacterized protein n=1 Tax=Tricharina praecox TaxID=43433 RepID=UPI00221EA6BB|nr:uncharacterized protein BZA05DRAFT_448560 [Tricharina praecox]KAI5844207.1 hypothetical protein BZA05DRAFT_448560 [Tricharina praecox]
MQFLNFLLAFPVVLLQLAGVAHAAPRGAPNTTTLPGVIVHNTNGFEWLSLPSSANFSLPALNLTNLLELSFAGLPLPDLPSGIPAPSRLSNQIVVHAAVNTLHCETSDAPPYRMYSEKILEALKKMSNKWCCIDKAANGGDPCIRMLSAGFPKPGAAATDICNYSHLNHICMTCGTAAQAIEMILDGCTKGEIVNWKQAGG